jgi:hypothetical protein
MNGVTSITLFAVSAIIIAVAAAVTMPIEYASAVSIGDSDSCGHHISNVSKKCSQNDTPLILPFP